MAITRYGTDKDVEKVIRKARKAGWEIELTGGNHIKFTSPRGGKPVIGSLSPGSSRAVRTLRHNLEKAGLS